MKTILPDRHPLPGQVCAVAPTPLLKRAALLFDRVYLSVVAPFQDCPDIPLDLSFGLANVDLQLVGVSLNAKRSYEFGEAFLSSYPGMTPAEVETIIRAEHEAFSILAIQSTYHSMGIPTVPILRGTCDLPHMFKKGDYATTYQAAYARLPVVNESRLSWQQVAEFRADMEATQRYRALGSWFRTLKGYSAAEIEDELELAINSYLWSLKKHAIETTTGGLSLIVGGIGGGCIARLLDMPGSAIFAAGSLLVSGVSVWMAERRLRLEEVQRGPESHVAVIAEAERRFQS